MGINNRSSYIKKMKKILIGAVSLLLVGFVLLPVNRVEAGACTQTKVESGKPQGGTAWESLHLDTSSHPEIIEYRIQWFNGGWSPWYVPGVGDLDSKTNYDGTKRLLWSYFQDHNYEIKTCDDSNTTAPVYITVESPNGGETYTDGQKITIKWKSQGVPTNNPVGVSLQIYDVNNISMGNIGLVDSSSVNDGQETITLPTLEYIKKANPGLFQNIIPGQHFKILVGGSAEYGSIQDYSDNFFSISGSNNTTSNKYVNLKVNGSHNPSTVAYNSVLNVTWDSNMDSCTWWGNYVKNTSGRALTEASIKQFKPYGSEKVYAVSHGADKKTPEYSNPLQIGIQCWSEDINIPSVSDSVNVPVNPPVVVTPPVTNPSVIVLTPNGGENYKPGDKITIRWKTNNLPYNPGTQVDIMDDRIKDWSTASLFGTVPALDYAKLVSSKGGEYVYEYTFIVPQNFNGSLPSQYQGIFGGQHYKFQITISNKEKDGTYKWTADDLSDTNFNIQTTSARSITVVSPNGGENYVPGQQVTVKWTSKGIPLDDNNFHIILSKAYTTERMYLWGYNDATSKTINDGVEVVTLPKSLAKGLYKIEISRLGSGVGDYDVYDDSDGGFNVNDFIVAYPTVSAVPSTIPKSSTYPTVVAVPTVNPITKTLRPGVKNDGSVKSLQEALIKQGYLSGIADGSYGNKTFNAVKYFQAKNKLTADGLVGKTTWNMVHSGILPTATVNEVTNPTTPTNQFPVGCTSSAGYSPITGQTCGTASGTTKTTLCPNGMTLASNCTTLPASNPPVSVLNPTCNSTSSPRINIVSPNGGETYSTGQKLAVNWNSCNVGNSVAIILEHYDINNILDKGINLTPSNTLNDGSEFVVLPVLTQNPESNYKIVVVDQQVIPGISESTNDYSDKSFTINDASKSITTNTTTASLSCPTNSIASGKPQGGTAWESLHLDTSSHPEIKKYRIQWFNGNWSPWYKPGVGDLDSKINDDGTNRLLWSYFQDHNYQTCTE